MIPPLEVRLRAALHEEANQVAPRPSFVSAAATDVPRRRRRRHRRNATAGATLLAVLAAGAAAALDTGSDHVSRVPTIDLNPPPTRLPPALNPDHLLKAPTEAEVRSLAWRDTALPRVLPTGVTAAPALSSDPVGVEPLLDTANGSVEDMPYDADATYAPDGTALEVQETPDGPGLSEITRWGDDGVDRQPLSVSYDAPMPPAATDRYLVFTGSGDGIVRTNARYDIGRLVVDLETGEPIAMLSAGRCRTATGCSDCRAGWTTRPYWSRSNTVSSSGRPAQAPWSGSARAQSMPCRSRWRRSADAAALAD